MAMRAVILASVFAAATAFAQVHGTPASVTSVGSTPGGRLVPNGVPASVTSLGPRGFTPNATPGINPLFPASGPLVNPLVPATVPVRSVHRGGHSGRGHHGQVAPVVPVYYGYPVYYSDYSYPEQQPQVQEPVVEQQPAQPQRLEIVVVDKRDEEKKKAALEEDLKQAAEPKKSDLTAAPEDPAIFVFKDGTRKELANFAVMAGNLYDLSDGKMFKIAMNTIDREATLAANAQVGRAIQLP
jgi:hypothetical protein